MRIADVVLVELTGDFPVDELRGEERQAQPLDVYPEFAGRGRGGGASAGDMVSHRAVYLEVRTDDGVTGRFGPVDGPHAPILRREIRDFVLGRDPLAIEQLWDLLWRRNRHARSGYYMMAMSAFDCALWDLKGKALGVPVYQLLGGLTRLEVPAYASMLGFSLEPAKLAARAKESCELGYAAQKWFFRNGPSQGGAGAAKNVEVARVLREAVGEGTRLMFDAFNSWDRNYAIELGQRIAEYWPTWLEEPVPCDRTDALREIRQRTGIPIATGEHLYTRWQVKTLLDAEAVDVVQADPDWCGGISELLKIVNLCSAYDIPVCPHGHSLHAALHVAAAVSPTALPMVEFLLLHQRNKQRFMKGYLEPVAGVLRPPDAPGLGLVIDETKVLERKELP